MNNKELDENFKKKRKEIAKLIRIGILVLKRT